MKKLTLTFLTAFFSLIAVAQYNPIVSGQASNNGGLLIPIHITISDSFNLDTALVFTDAAGNYMYTHSNWSNTYAFIEAYIHDCNGLKLSKTDHWSTTHVPVINFTYCTTPPPPSCTALFTKSQSLDSLGNPVPGQVDIFDMSTGVSPGYFWDFGDGSSSTSPSPTHTYTSNGVYILCLTITDSTCTDTYCDSISVDSAGILSKGAPGFTINVGGYVQPPAQPTGLSVNSLNQHIKIFPNPANDNINIAFGNIDSENTVVQLLNMNAQVVQEIRVRNNSINMDVSSLNAGVYILKVTTNSGLTSQKVVIQH